ncbi:MAG: S1C family serine protease, partial [Isosphaeraceae bacterium]
MIHFRRKSRAAMGVILAAAAGIGGMSSGASAQDAASLSASFHRASARVKGALVTVRVPEGLPSTQPMPPRTGPDWPMPRLGPQPSIVRSPEYDGPLSWTGVVIDAQRGHILTTDRPTRGAIQLVVTFPDGVERFTTEVRRDDRSDLALLVVDTKGLRLQPAAWGDPAKLEPGDWLVAMGQPGPGAPSLSAGVFSARREARGEFLLETDAAIPRVGAGGVLVNLAGEVVGIGKLGGRRNDGFEGMSHAIPADRARRIAADLAQFGRVRRGHLGVYIDATGPLALPPEDGLPGVRISAVQRDSPAAQAGLQRGDIIVAAGGRPVSGVAALQEAVERTPIGDELKLTVHRDDQTLEIPTRPRP